MAEPYLAIESLSKVFSGRWSLLGERRATQALDQISLTVERGQSIGIVGESGSGKSTLLRIILNLTRPTAGRVVYDGVEISALSEARFRPFRKRIQPIFQDPYSTFNPHFTIGSSIQVALDIHGIGQRGERRGIVLSMLEKVGLSLEHAERLPHQLSGGQRQRAAIARALVVGPELILADEPTSALDVSVQAQILNLLQDMKLEFGLTFIFVTHNLAVVRFMCDFIVVMRQGRIVEMGDNDAVFANPVDAYTRRLIAAVPTIGDFAR